MAPEEAPSRHAHWLPCKEVCMLGSMASAAISEAHEPLQGSEWNVGNLAVTQQKKRSSGRNSPERSQKQLPLADGANSFAYIDC